jgi:3-hydroxymyristoyl/3-hydroxydecanoyl-(acyl carrier protein) dehydratase
LTLFPRAGFEPVSGPGANDAYTVRVPAGSGCFDGHFDGAPILPGIAHLALVLDACAARLGTPCELTGVGDVRWRRPIRPGDELAVTITLRLADARSGQAGVPEGTAVRFSIQCGAEVASSGSVMVAAVGDSHA